MSKLMNAIEGISDKHIERLAYKHIPQKKIPLWLKIGTMAAGLVLIALTITTVVHNIPDNITSSMSESGIEPSAPMQYHAPDLFGSFEEFEKHEKNAETNAISFYYVPSSVPSGFELTEIAKRENIYVMVSYSISDAAMSSIDAQEYAGLNDYDSSRLQTLICERWLYPDGQKSLESFIADGYEPIEYEDRTYYRWDEHAEGDPEKRVIGYELAFLDDNTLIFLHLPAIDTFENMMKYADVKKVEIN